MREGRRKEAVEELMENIGIVMELQEVKRMGRERDEGKEMVWVKLGSKKQRGEVLENKKSLGRREELITEDLTWKERNDSKEGRKEESKDIDQEGLNEDRRVVMEVG